MKRISKRELLTYVALWAVMFLAPLISLYIHSTIVPGYEFKMMPVLHMWDSIMVLLALFIIHHLFVAPLLLDRHSVKLYSLGLVVLCALFVVFEYNHHPPRIPPEDEAPPMVQRMQNPADSIVVNNSSIANTADPKDSYMPPPREGTPPLSPNDIMSLLLLLLLFAGNLGVKVLNRNIEENERRSSLERQNLKQELSYLKYQVNPHFLMNTLNNIHALVDIDPEKAKSGIVKLSQMLRYMLYEGSKTTIPLDRGIRFLGYYIDMMSMRYENVDVKLEVPDPIPNVEVLPLLVVTFIENAFKHGVSYVEPSFIHIKFDVKDNHLIFNCVNSKHNCHF